MPKSTSVFHNIYFGSYQPYDRRYDLFQCTKDSLDYVQSLEIFKKLAVHHGCVNTICWSESGEILLSGSDDQHLCITNGSTYKTVANLETAHRANIFSAKFLPNCEDRKIISCSGDGLIIYTDLNRPEIRSKNDFNCHRGTAYKVVTVPNDPNSFLSCGEDGTVRWFDLRMKNSCSVVNCREDVLLSCPKSITALAVDQVFPYQFAIGCCDSSVGIYDRRALGTKAAENFNDKSYEGLVTKFSVPGFEGKSHRITSLAYSSDSTEVLVSYSSENLYLFNIKSFHNGSEPKLRRVYGTDRRDLPFPTKNNSSAPPMKRLRLRGDWSDTGPNARPECELRDDGQVRLSFHAHLMQHVSSVLNRMLDDSPEQTRRDITNRIRRVPATRASLATANISHHQVISDSTDGRTLADSVTDTASQSESEREHSSVSVPHTLSDGSVSRVTESPESSYSNAIDMYSCTGVPTTCVTEGATPLTVEEPFVPNDTASQTDAPEMAATVQGRLRMLQMTDPRVSTLTRDTVPASNNLGVEEQDDASVVNSSNINFQIAACHGPVTPQPVAKFLEPLLFNAGLENLPSHNGVDDGGNAESNDNVPSESALNTNITMNTSPRASSDSLFRDLAPSSSASCSSCSITPGESTALEGILRRSEEGNREIADDHERRQNCSQSSVTSPEISNHTVIGSPSAERSDTIETSNHVLMDSPPREHSDTEEEVLNEDEDEDSSSGPENRSRFARRSWRRRAFKTPRPRRHSSSSDGPEEDIGTLEGDLEDMFLRGLPQPVLRQKYTGHRNARTMIKEANFWGADYIMSGSDCGHVFIWNRHTAKLAMILEADRHVVNCVQPHPFDPVLATSGIDYDVKLWAPYSEHPNFDVVRAAEITSRNEIMLEETRDTITVPASFMIRMLASFNHLRQSNPIARWRRTLQANRPRED